MATIIRGITAHEFASSKERDAFLSGVTLTTDGTLPLDVDLAKIVGAIGGQLAGTNLNAMLVGAMVGEVKAAREAAASEAAAGVVEIIPCRNGEGFNVYRGPQGARKFLVYIGADTVARIHGLNDQLAAIKANGTEKYYSARDAYEILRGANKGSMADAEPAVVVKVAAGGLATAILHSGSAADDYAKKHNLVAVNNPPKPPVTGK